MAVFSRKEVALNAFEVYVINDVQFKSYISTLKMSMRR